MKISFDPVKRAETLAARGLDMADVAAVFEGPRITVEDMRQNYGEVRFISVGLLAGRMVVVVWTVRGASRRIISLRKANEREQDAHGAALRP